MIEVIPNWHPAFVHFPIAFATAAVFFMAIGKLCKMKSWAKQCLIFGRWMLWGAALFAGIAAVFGWFAYNSVEHDEVSHAAMTLHRNWALATLAGLSLLTVWDYRRGRSGQLPSSGLLILLGVAWLLLMSTAWHGGELVYRYGLGVMSLPDVESEAEPHQHGGAEHAHDELPILETPHETQASSGVVEVVPKAAAHVHAAEESDHHDHTATPHQH